MGVLSEFLVDAYSALGGLAEVSSDVLEAVAPPGSDLTDSVRVWAGDGECPPHEEMLHLGHPVLDAALAVVRRDPCCSVRHLPVPWRRVGVEGMARKSLGFRNTRASFGEEGAASVPVVVYWFRVTFTWDEKREELVRVAVDAQTGAPFDPALLDKAYLEPGPAVDADPRLDGLEERARAALASAVEGRAALFERDARRHLEVERARLEEYYGAQLSDLDRRGRRADSTRQDALEAKRASTEADLETRRRDLEEKYRLRVTARLCAVERIDIPRARVSVRLEGRKAAREAVVSYNFLTRALDPWPCEGCRRALSGMYLCRDGHLVCPACASECEGCRVLACRACGAAQCEMCPAMRCASCDPSCETCGRGMCGRHRGQCHRIEEAPAPRVKEKKARKAPAQQPWSVPGLLLQVFAEHCRVYSDLESLLRPIDELMVRGDMAGAARMLAGLAREGEPGPVRERMERVRDILMKTPARAVQELSRLVGSPKRPQVGSGPHRTEKVRVLVGAALDYFNVKKSILKDAQVCLRVASPGIEGSTTAEEGWAAAIVYEVMRGYRGITMPEAAAMFEVTAATVNNRLHALRELMRK